MVQDVLFNQGLDGFFFGIDLAGGDDGDGVFCVEPADFPARCIVDREDAPVQFVGVFLFLDGTDGLDRLFKGEIGDLFVRHGGSLLRGLLGVVHGSGQQPKITGRA